MGESGDQAWLSEPRPEPARGRPVRLVDLFAGCGGISVGVEEAARQLGHPLDVRLFAEIDPHAAATYANNFHVDPSCVESDVRELFNLRRGEFTRKERKALDRVGHVDLLVGGPPCQGHSTLNNHTRGNDPKNDLYLAMVRAAEVLGPTAVLIENVPAVKRDTRDVVGRAKVRLREAGYEVDDVVVDMHEIGVPQTRRRHVLLAHRQSVPIAEEALRQALVDSTERTLRWAFESLPALDDSPFNGAPSLSPRNLQRFHGMMAQGLYDLPPMLRPPCQSGQHKYKSMYGRLHYDRPAQTITTGFGSPGQGRYFHPEEPRALTAHEAARLQFFPDWFDFSALTTRTALATAIGNAVPPKLGFVLAHYLLSL